MDTDNKVMKAKGFIFIYALPMDTYNRNWVEWPMGAKENLCNILNNIYFKIKIE